jgi:hypothetical protein
MHIRSKGAGEPGIMQCLNPCEWSRRVHVVCDHSTYKCMPSSTITAIVPSAATAIRDPFSLPSRSSPRPRLITVTSSVLKIVQCPISLKLLSVELVRIIDKHVRTHRASQHAMPPSFNAPNKYAFLFHSSVTDHSRVALELNIYSFGCGPGLEQSSENVVRHSWPFASYKI